jgi:hypothetical protein
MTSQRDQPPKQLMTVFGRAADALVPGGFTRFEDWARRAMKPSPA